MAPICLGQSAGLASGPISRRLVARPARHGRRACGRAAEEKSVCGTTGTRNRGKEPTPRSDVSQPGSRWAISPTDRPPLGWVLAAAPTQSGRPKDGCAMAGRTVASTSYVVARMAAREQYLWILPDDSLRKSVRWGTARLRPEPWTKVPRSPSQRPTYRTRSSISEDYGLGRASSRHAPPHLT
jgi:hypothetical protein